MAAISPRPSAPIEGALGASGAALLLLPVPAVFWLNGQDPVTMGLAPWALLAVVLVGIAGVLAGRRTDAEVRDAPGHAPDQ